MPAGIVELKSPTTATLECWWTAGDLLSNAVSFVEAVEAGAGFVELREAIDGLESDWQDFHQRAAELINRTA